MFATIINDVYKKECAEEIAAALDDLCSPNDNYGWSSDGIYCYWDYNTKEIYYIGLSVDLTERFKQHNGLITTGSGNKKEYIDKYFEENDILGFSIFVQSPLSQPSIPRKNKNLIWENPDSKDRKNHKLTEGILLESYKQNHGKFPKWNKVGGSSIGQKRVKDGNYTIIEGFTSTTFHPLVSRTSLRELSSNPTYEGYENGFLHVIRMGMLHLGFDFYKALEYAKYCDSLDRYEEMKKENYMCKNLEYGMPDSGVIITAKNNDNPELTTLNFKPMELRRI